MRLTEITFDEGRPVDGYGPNFFRIAGEVFEGQVAILPNSCGHWLGFEDPTPFVLAANDLDVVFVGTGAQICQIPLNFTRASAATRWPRLFCSRPGARCPGMLVRASAIHVEAAAA